MTQIQITQIENGWLVGTQPQQATPQNPQGVAPRIIFCETYEDVCTAIKQFFPVVVSK